MRAEDKPPRRQLVDTSPWWIRVPGELVSGFNIVLFFGSVALALPLHKWWPEFFSWGPWSWWAANVRQSYGIAGGVLAFVLEAVRGWLWGVGWKQDYARSNPTGGEGVSVEVGEPYFEPGLLNKPRAPKRVGGKRPTKRAGGPPKPLPPQR